MDTSLLYTLFLENPRLPEAVRRFCQTLPACRGQYLPYEEALNRCWAEENRAYYLFGLHLRRAALEALGAGERPAP